MTETATAPLDIKGLEVHNAGEYGEASGYNLTLYGKGGAGKTTLAATALNSRFIRDGRMLHCNAEGNGHVLHHLGERMKFTQILRWGQVEALTTHFKAHKHDHGYDCVIWDNMSELQELHIRSIVPEGTDKQIQHYGKNTAAMLDFTRTWRVLSEETKLVVIFIAWEDAWKEDTGTMHSQVQFTPSLQKQFPGIVSSVGLLTAEGRNLRKLSFIASKNNDTKLNRSQDSNAMGIPLELYNPDLGPMLDTILGGDKFPTERYARPNPTANAAQAAQPTTGS